jgi:hypothetical protein
VGKARFIGHWTNARAGCTKPACPRCSKNSWSRHDITSEQIANSSQGGQNPLALSAAPSCPPAAAAPGTGHCRLFSPHRSYVSRRPKPPDQIEFSPTHTGAEHRRRPPQWHGHEARGRCSYDGVRLPQIRTRQPLSTLAAAAPTHMSTRAFGGRHWVANWALCSGRRAGRCNGGDGAAQRPFGNGRSPAWYIY